MKTAYICVGSNMGDRLGYVQQANNLLNDTKGIKVVQSSSLYESEPVGFKDQEWFVNAVLEIKTSLSPSELLDECMRIEKQLGRVRDAKNQWGERTLDLDILFYDNTVISKDNLQIPHPRVQERAYALVPMLEIAPDFVHPVIKKTIFEIHSELEDPEEVYLYGTRGGDF